MTHLVVIPTYNECATLPSLVEQLLLIRPHLDVLVVDDNSPDGTGAIADAIANRTSRVHVLHRSQKAGLGRAYAAGFQWALDHNYEAILQMDADFSHRPSDVPNIVAAVSSGTVVLGSRLVPGGKMLGRSRVRGLITQLGSFYARTILGIPARDCTTGFRCLSRSALERLDLSALNAAGYGFQVETLAALHTAGFAIVEVPIVFPDRSQGHSKMSLAITLEAAWLVLKLRFGLARLAIKSRSMFKRPATRVRSGDESSTVPAGLP